MTHASCAVLAFRGNSVCILASPEGAKIVPSGFGKNRLETVRTEARINATPFETGLGCPTRIIIAQTAISSWFADQCRSYHELRFDHEIVTMEATGGIHKKGISQRAAMLRPAEHLKMGRLKRWKRFFHETPETRKNSETTD